MPDQVPFEHFVNAYQMDDQHRPPWDIGAPQPVFVEAAKIFRGTVLESGCGTGEHAIYFASLGHDVVAIDAVEKALEEARSKAASRKVTVDFRNFDALQLSKLDRQFDSVLDCGLFHVFSDEDRRTYVKQLAEVTRTGSMLLLHCFSDAEPGDNGPRRVTELELRESFSDQWRIHTIDAARYIVRDDLTDVSFSAGGPHAWFARIERL